MNTIQILIVAFVVLSFAYLILKIRDDIREAKNEGKKSDDVIGPPTSFVGTIEFSTAGKHIDIVDFTSMPTRAKNGRFLPKGKKDKRSAALKAMLQSDKELISNVQKEWFRRCFPEPNEDSTIEDAIRPIVFRC